MIPEPYGDMFGKINEIAKIAFSKAGNEINANIDILKSISNDTSLGHYITGQQIRINNVISELINNPIISIYESRKQLQLDKESMDQMHINMTKGLKNIGRDAYLNEISPYFFNNLDLICMGIQN